MATIALPLLVLLPLLAAVGALVAPAAWARRVALAGAGLAFLVALWAAAHFGDVRDLRRWYTDPGGPLEQALARAGVDDPYAREALADLVFTPRAPADEERALAALAHLDEARRAAQWVVEGDPEREAKDQATLRAAEAEVAALRAALARVRAEEAHALRVVQGRAGPRFKLPWTRPWHPPLGESWSLGVDGLSLPLLLATTLLALVAVLGAPDVRQGGGAGPLRGDGGGGAGRGPLVALLALEGLLVAMVAALDVAALHVAWALLLLPLYFVVAPRGPAAAGAALRLVVVGGAGALGGLVAAGALAASAAAGGEPPTWSLLALNEAARRGQVPPGHQQALLGTLLLATATRLPLPGLGRAQADALAALPAWLQGFAVWTLLLGAVFPVLRVAWPLAPEAVLSNLGATVAALGVGALAGGGLLALRARTGPALLTATTLAHAGLVLLGLGAARSVSAQGAVLDVLVAGLATSALAPLLAGVAARTGRPELSALVGLGAAAPKLAALVGLLLALAGGVTAATVLVVAGAVRSPLPPWLAGLGLLACVLLAVAHLRLALTLVTAPASGEPLRVADLSDDEAIVSLPLLVAAVLAGVVVPTLALDLVGPAAEWLTGIAVGPADVGG